MNDHQNKASLSRLAMLKEEKEDTQKEFAQILRFLSLPDVSEEALDVKKERRGDWREDVPGKGTDKETVLSLAPAVSDGYIAVPKALEDPEE